MAKTRKFGKAEVEVSIRDRVGTGLKAITRKMENFGRGLGSIGTRVSAVGAVASGAFLGIGAGLVAATTKFAAFGDVLDKTSARTGVSVEALSELGFAAEQSGADLAAVEKAMFGMSRALYDAANGSKEANDALAALGLSSEQLQGMNPEDQFQLIADSMGQVADESTRGAIAQKIFGRSGRQLLPMLGNVRALREEARELGLVLSKEDATSAAAFTDAMNRAKRTIGAVVLQVGAAMAPALTTVADIFAKLTTNVVTFIRDNRQLVVAIGAGVAAGLALATALGGIGAALVVAGAVLGSLTAIFGALGAVVAFIVSPLGLIIAGFTALTAWSLQASGSLSVLGEMFGMLGQTATTAWGGIVAAIQSGDLKTAGEIAFTALEVAWLTLTTKMKEVWAQVADFFQNIWLDVIKWIIQAGSNIYFSLAKTFDQLGNALAAGFDIGFVYIKGAIDQIITSIAKAIVEAQRFFGILNSDTAEGAKQALDRDLAARAAGRQAGLDSRAASRGAGLEERDAARRATQKSFLDAVTEDLNRRRASTTVNKSALDAANERLAALQGLSESAKAAASGGGSIAKPDQLANALQAFRQTGRQNQNIKAIGTSSAAAVAAGAFGVRSNAANETAQNTRKTAQLLQKVLLRPNGFV